MRSGDRVKFLNDTGGGVIVRFLDPETVLVRIEEGFEVPVKLTELIPDISKKVNIYQDNKSKENEIIPEVKEKDIAQPLTEIKSDRQENTGDIRNSGKIYLAFTHMRKSNNLIIHLINDSDFNIYYTIASRKLEQHLHQYSGLLEADTKIVLGSIRLIKTDEPILYKVQYLGYKTGYYQPFEPVDRLIEIDAKKLTDGQYEMENDFFEGPAAVFELSESPVSYGYNKTATRKDLSEKNFINEKIQVNHSGKPVKDKEPSEIMEIDLHIHEIIEDDSGLSEGEILDIQLKRFEVALETALNGKVKKIVFIHGVGQGKLKYEITKILQKKYPDLKYQDASFKEYGFGATMVLL